MPCDKFCEVLISDALREKLKDKLESNCPITRAGAYLVLVGALWGIKLFQQQIRDHFKG